MKRSEKQQRKVDKLFDAIGSIDDDLIYETQSYTKVTKKSYILRFIPVTLSLVCIILGAILTFSLAFRFINQSETGDLEDAENEPNSSELKNEECSKDGNAGDNVCEDLTHQDDCTTECETECETEYKPGFETESMTEYETDKSEGFTQTPSESTPDSIVPTYLCYVFKYISDMEHYINTGSENSDEYIFAPVLPVTDKSEIVKLQNYYRPLVSVLGVDITGKEIEIVVTSNSDESVIFEYQFDNSCIKIHKLAGNVNSASQYYRYESNNNFIDFSESQLKDDGYVLRQINDYEIVYQVNNNIPDKCGIVLDGYLLEIIPIAGHQTSDRSQSYCDFISSSEMNYAADLFKDNDSVIVEAISSIINGLRKE